jgi:hypothetical protein
LNSAIFQRGLISHHSIFIIQFRLTRLRFRP